LCLRGNIIKRVNRFKVIVVAGQGWPASIISYALVYMQKKD
jgi:hypothetical protein